MKALNLSSSFSIKVCHCNVSIVNTIEFFYYGFENKEGVTLP